MNTRLLIDAIVRQTTVLIAQLSTTAGIRAPLAHIADQVFVELVKEIERQGVGKKVVADMFGMALRTYQKKVQRLTESATVRDRTLWEAVLDYLQSHGSSSRADVLHRFRHDGESNVAAVLNDLVISGLVYKTGAGGSTIYGVTSDEDYQRILAGDELEALASLLWVSIYRKGPIGADALGQILIVDPKTLARALENLLDDGRIEATEDEEGEVVYRAAQFLVPVGSSSGWEGALFDHYQAVVTAVCTKLSGGAPRSAPDDTVGGATLSFDIYPGHPGEQDVYNLLKTVRTQVNHLWNEVSNHNKQHPVDPEEKVKVTFYFGQNVQTQTPEDSLDEPGELP